MAEYVTLARSIPDLLPTRDRSSGTHVSHCIHRICVALGHYLESDPDGLARAAANDNRPLTDEEQKRLNDHHTRLQLGQALEWAIITRYAADDPARYFQPGELEKDGLFGTPDLCEIRADGSLAIHEIKLTWMSAINGPESDKFWKYVVQLMAYCWMVKTLTGVLHVAFVNGDYRGDRTPVYEVWEFTFTHAELAENWAMIVAEAREIRKEQAA